MMRRNKGEIAFADVVGVVEKADARKNINAGFPLQMGTQNIDLDVTNMHTERPKEIGNRE